MVGNWYAHEIFLFMLNIASKYDLSIKEVETVLIRKQCQELGFECFHEKVDFAKTTGLPYCKSCWTRLEQTKPPVLDVNLPPTGGGRGKGRKPRVISPARYRPLKTFLDEIEEEKARRATFDKDNANPEGPDPATTTTTQ